MKKQRVTIREVANEVGVSIQTVSRVLNERPDVAPETRERILEVIDRLQYRPSALARSLIKQRSAMLGVVTAGLSYIGPSRTLNGILVQAETMGYSLLLDELPSFETGNAEPILNRMLARQVDGLIWAVPEVGNNRQHLLDRLPNLPVPIVFLTMRPHDDLTVVSVDNRMGGHQATTHLLEQGFRQIAHMAGPLSWWEAQQRKAGWASVLADAGLPMDDRFLVQGNWSSSSGERAARQLLRQYPEMDAVFVANDQMALGIMHVARQQGLTLPEDLAIVGFDGIPESAYFSPPLTTVHHDLFEVGATAVKQVVRMIEVAQNSQETETKSILIKPKLIARESTQFRSK
ncbi:MAG: LacI family DNA-binding transcriptional regulator [Chloroflexota bacterium]|nr:LacI family DNA-binding transcriptional regulator [Chloroflexota bacterium]